jgi:hypothetical protein
MINQAAYKTGTLSCRVYIKIIQRVPGHVCVLDKLQVKPLSVRLIYPLCIWKERKY